jgi:hypothetical protein
VYLLPLFWIKNHNDKNLHFGFIISKVIDWEENEEKRILWDFKLIGKQKEVNTLHVKSFSLFNFTSSFANFPFIFSKVKKRNYSTLHF